MTQELQLLNDPEVQNVLRLLKQKGYTGDQLKNDFEEQYGLIFKSNE